ncbi:hypothetical protein BZG76_03085 [Salinivibrio sp. AR647]|nr:hypothetical protein BZG76_03085 [Salinivibrio sp. AR647]OOE95917.1 hypothetical protein BZG75_00840 [Salinivibrio sp. AR640]
MHIVNGRLSRSVPNLTSRLIFGFDVGWRAAHIVIMIGIVLALMPTYAYFNINDAIRDWHQFDLRCRRRRAAGAPAAPSDKFNIVPALMPTYA